MCKIRCPLCRKRICDLIAIAEGRTVVRIRCPHCCCYPFFLTHNYHGCLSQN